VVERGPLGRFPLHGSRRHDRSGRCSGSFLPRGVRSGSPSNATEPASQGANATCFGPGTVAKSKMCPAMLDKTDLYCPAARNCTSASRNSSVLGTWARRPNWGGGDDFGPGRQQPLHGVDDSHLGIEDRRGRVGSTPRTSASRRSSSGENRRHNKLNVRIIAHARLGVVAPSAVTVLRVPLFQYV